MKAGSHIVIGMAGALALETVRPYLPAGPVALGFAVGANVLGSLMPDVDSDESTIRQVTRTNRKAGCLGWLVSWLMRALGGHRAVTHTLLALAPLAGFALLTGYPWALAYLAGYLAHLLADMLTPRGLPIFWPVTSRRFHLLPRPFRIVTGSLSEYLITVAVGVWMAFRWRIIF